jgi:ribonuclease HI
MKPLVYIHADESCLGVQFTDRDSPGGAAGMVEFWKGGLWTRRDFWLSEPATTNNRMALRGAAELLDQLRESCRVLFTSDSQYLVRGMSEWVPQWKRLGWRRKAGAIENLELWKALDHAAAQHDVKWRWVRGHAGNPYNEYVNFLAVRAARKQLASNGLVESAFTEWLEEQREKYNRFTDFLEAAAPDPADFAVDPPK